MKKCEKYFAFSVLMLICIPVLIAVCALRMVRDRYCSYSYF